ncbi:killer cell lectin-like receptor subfamily B member 1B allele C isoform X4 [Anser cygnoides]|uniref:killer cell lectin-like receptor subfamily B member 1B allele C isoform X4 n=1 Tax=Anser cygnoides TaxID=8845 RepID=UPI0020097B00|nr:C-type lectin domain family 1 member A-like isoform X4 [Anser cygnoides]
MSENLIYADLNLTESRRSRLQKDINVQDSTYAELNVQSLDTSAVASYASFDLGMIYRITYICSTVPSGQTDITNFKDSRRDHPTTSSPQDRETLSMTYDKAQDCPQHWKRNGKKCYFFSQTAERKNWKAFHDECTGMHSELVTIDNKKELDYLISQSTNHYYLLGLQYNESKKNWEWINGREHSTDMFNITGPITGPPDYFCTVVGFGEVSTAPCYESSTTKNMCEKGASISEKAEEERQKTDSSRNLTPSFV